MPSAKWWPFGLDLDVLMLSCSVALNWIEGILFVVASQITSLTIVYSTVYSGSDQRKHQSTASMVFVRGIHQWPVNSPHKGPVTRKMFPFDDVIMERTHLNCLQPSENFIDIQVTVGLQRPISNFDGPGVLLMGFWNHIQQSSILLETMYHMLAVFVVRVCRNQPMNIQIQPNSWQRRLLCARGHSTMLHIQLYYTSWTIILHSSYRVSKLGPMAKIKTWNMDARQTKVSYLYHFTCSLMLCCYHGRDSPWYLLSNLKDII